jgi:uncharacterized SAM-binding protein YcdF (DUF218 family)
MLIVLLWVLGVIVVSPLVYFVWMHTASVQRRSADALIVLGYRCDGGEIPPLLQERLDTALRLLESCSFRYVILSGGAVASQRTEAEIMRDYLIGRGVTEERILLENQSRNTVHNIVNCGILLRQYGLRSCLLVSNSFHIRRMKYIMKRLNMPAYFYAGRSLRTLFRQWKLTFQEIRAFRKTLPWVEKALNLETPRMMGKKEAPAAPAVAKNNES